MGACGSTIPDWFPWRLTGRGKMRYAQAGHARVPPSNSWPVCSRKLTWVVLLLLQLVLSGCEQEQSAAAESERTLETAPPSDAMGSSRTNDPRTSGARLKPASAEGMDQAGDVSLNRARRQLDLHIKRLESLFSGSFLQFALADGEHKIGFTINQVRRVDNRLVFRYQPTTSGSVAGDRQAVVRSEDVAFVDLRRLEKAAVKLTESEGDLHRNGTVLRLNLPFSVRLGKNAFQDLGVGTIHTPPSIWFECAERFAGNCRIAAEVLVRMIEPARSVYGPLPGERSTSAPNQSSESQPPGIGIIGRWQHTAPAFPGREAPTWVIEFNEGGTYCFLDQSNGASHQGRFVAGASKWSLSGTWSSHPQLAVETPFEDSGTYHRSPDNKPTINGRYAKTTWESMGSLDDSFAKSACGNTARALRNR